MNPNKSSLWQELRPGLIILALIIVAVAGWWHFKPNKIQGIEKYKYHDTVTPPEIRTISKQFKLHKLRKGRYTGVSNQISTRGAFKGQKFEIDFYPFTNILDITPTRTATNSIIAHESKKKPNSADVKNTTELTDDIRGVSSKLQGAGDANGGAQLTIHGPHSHHPAVDYSAQGGKEKYNTLAINGKISKSYKNPYSTM